MSDCSTEAMAPKERPGTCGNCGRSCGHRAKLYGCVYDYVPCLLNGTFEHEINYCSEWTERTDTGEQRYQQLAHEAKAMYLKLEAIIAFDTLSGNQIREAVRFSLADRRSKLEALGVSVDD